MRISLDFIFTVLFTYLLGKHMCCTRMKYYNQGSILTHILSAGPAGTQFNWTFQYFFLNLFALHIKNQLVWTETN